MAPVLAADRLRKSYGVLTAVADVSFEVAAGEIPWFWTQFIRSTIL